MYAILELWYDGDSNIVILRCSRCGIVIGGDVVVAVSVAEGVEGLLVAALCLFLECFMLVAT